MLQTLNFQFNPLYKPNQLICGTGQTAIVTGWTVKENVAKRLNADDYAVIGQLYSATRGINFLIRNLLANPHVCFLVLIDATKEDKNSGSCQCLLDFFQHGYEAGISENGRQCWVIQSAITGYIDFEVSSEALESLRHSIQFVKTESMQDTIEQVKLYAQNLPVSISRRSFSFPIPQIKATTLPGERYGHRIEGKTIAETWIKIIHRIKTTGTIRPTGYDGKWQELIDLMAVVTDEPEDFYFPEPNYLPVDRDFLTSYIPQIVEDAPYQEGVKYTYGQRLRSWFGKDQIKQVIHKLINEIDAASGVMSLWDVQDHEKGGSPCLNHIWVRVVDNELSLTAIFRSNDMFSAWPANAMGLRALQRLICDEINQRSDYSLAVGPLITISQSAHIYDDCWENADQLIKEQYTKISNQLSYFDPVGNFLIELENQAIHVKQLSPHSGEIVKTYSGKNPLKLIRNICQSCPAIQAAHIGYLGIELQKASESLKNQTPYHQDQ